MTNAKQYLVTIRKSRALENSKEAQQTDLLEGFIKHVQQNPEAEIVGSTNKERIVIRATDQAVSRMRSQYGDRLIIEPDATLDLFTK